MKEIILTLSIISYCLALLVLIMRLRSQQGSHDGAKETNVKADTKFTFWLISLVAIMGHGFLLFDGLFIQGGLNLGVFKALSLVGWMIVILILLTSLRKPIECLSIVLYPLAVLTLLLDFFLISKLEVQYGGTWQLQAHVFASITAYSFLTIAVVQSIVLSIQDHQIHNRQPAGFVKALPPLQIMEHLLFQIITIGFILLTLGLLIGILFLTDIFAQHLVHKTVLSLFAWAIFAFLLWGRWRFGWRGRKPIRLALGGFLVLMLAFVGTKIVMELILERTTG